jgi:hypothetical protein
MENLLLPWEVGKDPLVDIVNNNIETRENGTF